MGCKLHRHAGGIQHPDGRRLAILRSALVGSLMTCTPLRSSACGTTDTVAPNASVFGKRHLDAKRARHRVRAGGHFTHHALEYMFGAHTRTSTPEPTLIMETLSSGTANTTSRGPSWAMRTTGVPAATTCPTSPQRR
jgi:hypothetical protein